MGWNHWGWGSHWAWGMHFPWFGIGPGLLLVVVIVLAMLFRRPGSWEGPGYDHRQTGATGSETAREILDRRYASGEITREQYEQMKRDVESGRSSP